MAATTETERVGVRARVQRRTVRSLAGAQVLSGIGVVGSIPAGSLLAADIGGEGIAGLAQTSGTIGAALLALPLAKLALARGRRPALTLGYAIGALGAIVVIVASVWRSVPLVLLGCLLVGVASAAGYQGRYAATDLAEPDTRARALAFVIWGSTVGAVLGPNLLAVDGGLSTSVGLPALAGPYLVAAACLAAAALVLLLLLRPDPYLLATQHREAAGDSVTRPTLRAGLAHLRTRPVAVLGIGVVSVGHVVMVMVMVMTPVHMAHVDVTLQLIGLVISVHVAGMYAFSPVVGWSVDRWGRVPIAVLGLVILAVACGIAGLAPAGSVPLLGTGLFLLGLGWSCTLIAGSTILTEATEPTERPAVQGLSDLAMNVTGALGGVVAGIVVMWGSYGLLCAVALVPLAGVAVWIAGVSRRAVRTSVR